MNPLIIDTDPGVDDALAISFANFAQLPLIGITTVYGNATVGNTTQNALTILELLGSRSPVYQGAAKPVKNNARLAVVHGENGLGGFSLDNPAKCKSDQSAEDFLVKTLTSFQGKPLDLCCIGPLTNIALVARANPDLFDKKKRLIIMGGAVYEGGNVTPYAEFNTYNDPLALQEVIGLDSSITIIPLELCRKVTFTREDFDLIRNKNIQSSFKQITDFYIKSYMKAGEFTGFTGGVMYDLLTVAYILKPEYFETQAVFLDVHTELDECYGRTQIQENREPNCQLATRVAAKKVKDMFFEVMNTTLSLT